jgi:hypothetical protein
MGRPAHEGLDGDEGMGAERADRGRRSEQAPARRDNGLERRILKMAGDDVLDRPERVRIEPFDNRQRDGADRLRER